MAGASLVLKGQQLGLRDRGNNHGAPGGQHRGSGGRLRITCAQVLGRFLFTAQQVFRMIGGQPAAVFGDADGHHFIFVFINGLQHRCRREQRNFVLAAAAAKQDSHAAFLHGFHNTV